MTIILNGARLQDREQLHSLCKRLLSLPEYYGGNADALYDCLSERTQPVDLTVLNLPGSPAEKEIRKVMRVMEDLNGTVTVL